MAEKGFEFARHERLRKRADYLRLYARGQKVFGRHLVLYLEPGALPCSRLGITVSRKVGRPVVRNRIKRQLREIFRRQKRFLRPACDLVVNVKRSAATASFRDLSEDFLEALGPWLREDDAP